MIKDFWRWHVQKEKINNQNSRLLFHEREVWWCSMGINVGFEEDGKGKEFVRPVLVFKKFSKEVFWAIPITTKIKTNRFYTPVTLFDGRSRRAILSQLRLMDAKRLIDKIGTISSVDYVLIQKAVIALCG